MSGQQCVFINSHGQHPVTRVQSHYHGESSFQSLFSERSNPDYVCGRTRSGACHCLRCGDGGYPHPSALL